MDAKLAVTASASAGGAASPAAQTRSIIALAKGADQKMSAPVTLSCLQPGVQRFTIAGTIAPARPDDTDPNSANNATSITVEVECVVPIAINIRPGNRGNVYNLTLNADAIPVALLTTRAGEYGLPLAFDATRAVTASLRFGQRALVFANQAGSLEHQQKVQRVDSYELDEITRDGDLDIKAQFSRENTGLTGPTRRLASRAPTSPRAGRASSSSAATPFARSRRRLTCPAGTTPRPGIWVEERASRARPSRPLPDQSRGLTQRAHVAGKGGGQIAWRSTAAVVPQAGSERPRASLSHPGSGPSHPSTGHAPRGPSTAA